ncbi:MAG: 3-isopropylmalate/(R)-2-methylmalate dehydratase small subunit [Planctomycetota bacterium]|jgi:3-isopropylmalate/(R)-2-methylmalate dehydratase small subunit
MRSTLRSELSVLNHVLSGRAFILGDNVDSFEILARRHRRTSAPALLGRNLLHGPRSELARLLRPGDVLVAGRNFGYRSHTEHAVMAILGAGIRVVIAASFSRSFLRRSRELGLTLIECPEAVEGIADRDELVVDLNTGRITNRTFAASFDADLQRGNLGSIRRNTPGVPALKEGVA